MSKLSQKPYDKLNKFIQRQAPSFTSLKQRRDEIRKSKHAKSGQSAPELNIEDPNFASVVNANGVFQIGKLVFKITNDYTYIFKNRKAFNNFDFSNLSVRNKSNPVKTYVEEEPCIKNRQMVQLQEDVYRTQVCGGGTIGGGGGSGGDDDDEYTDPSDLDIRANPEKNYPSKITQEYRSGGTDGRLKGKSWNRNFYVFSSIGTKSVHERHTWLRWWNRKAEKITLESYVKYSYGEKLINPTELRRSLKAKLYDLTKLIPSGVESVLQNTFNLLIGEELSTKIWVRAKNIEFTLLTQKVQDNRFNYSVYPSKEFQEGISKVKYDAKKIRKVYDWSTAVVSYPPGIKQTAVDFKLEALRSKHTLKHDGYHFGFITGNRD